MVLKHVCECLVFGLALQGMYGFRNRRGIPCFAERRPLQKEEFDIEICDCEKVNVTDRRRASNLCCEEDGTGTSG